jgi:hypothetical protein
MKKELIIIVYEIPANSLSEQVQRDIKNNGLSMDNELQKDYHIREFIVPTDKKYPNIKTIYPISNYVSPEIEKLIEEITNKIANSSDDNIIYQLKKLVRELKLRKLEIC